MNVKRLRERKGMTQASLAKAAGLHRVYVAQIETHVKVPSIATLERLAKALKVKPAELLK